MPQILMTTEDFVKAIASEYGLDTRANDAADGVLDTALLNRMIDRASVWLLQQLSPRYSQSQLAGNNPPTTTPNWVAWQVAVLTCYYLDTRKFNPGHQSIVMARQEVIDAIARLIAGEGYIPGIDEPENKPTVTNFTLDHRYRHGPVRSVETTSTGRRLPGTLKSNPAPYAGTDYLER